VTKGWPPAVLPARSQTDDGPAGNRRRRPGCAAL